ncbi:transposase family protein [Streptomyces griseosporeus]|uniref:transposase family protein n=1 Tax=Streptomyces griseosporeus TaxID=1910 RepID=UPI0036F86A3B
MGSCELSDVLFPGIELRAERLQVAGRTLFVDAVGTAPPGCCPDCGDAARRVHSRYWRRPADRPVGGRKGLVRLRVRRFLCDKPMCSGRTFVEQVEGFTRSHGQSSPARRELDRFVAVELGGRPGERLCRRLTVSGRRTSLIRVLSAPVVPDRAPQVADRWHLLQNLSAVVEKTCHQHRNCLRKHAQVRPSLLPRPESPHPHQAVAITGQGRSSPHRRRAGVVCVASPRAGAARQRRLQRRLHEWGRSSL